MGDTVVFAPPLIITGEQIDDLMERFTAAYHDAVDSPACSRRPDTEERPMAIGIVATGSYLPDHIVTNDDLARTVDTSDTWITSRTGIRERRRAHEDQSTSDLGRLAALAALRDHDIAAEQLDALVVATSSPDQIQPSTACNLHAGMGLHQIPAFDVGAVCSGFVYATAAAAGLMNTFSQYNHVMVVGCEAYSRVLDYEDRGTCVFFGDGAGAAVLGKVPDGYGILGCDLIADSTRLDVVGIPAGGTREPADERTVAERRHYFRMDGRRVWDFATQAVPQVVKGPSPPPASTSTTSTSSSPTRPTPASSRSAPTAAVCRWTGSRRRWAATATRPPPPCPSPSTRPRRTDGCTAATSSSWPLSAAG